MKRLYSKTAFTLFELIITVSLIVVVLLGVFAVNNILENNNQDYGQRYLIRSETQATLNHILNDASLAVGSGTTVGTPPATATDTGILIGSAMGAADTNSFCIHQNTSGGIWVCYTFNPATYQISYCDKAYNVNDGSGKRGAEPSAVCTTASQFLGSAYSIGVPSFAPSSNLLLFSITVTNCLNNTLATCQANGTSSDPANNPEVQVSGSVFPLQEGT